MPIYEYRVVEGEKGCTQCRTGVEVIQPVGENPQTTCPECSAPMVRVFSAPSFRMHGGEASPVEKQIRDYEKDGMYSHAAELADKASEKTNRKDLKARAMDNYKKAGYKDL
jgi:putative FmdB family regulatory protein